MKYRKKPIEVEAFRLGIDYIPDWFMDKVTTNDIVLHGKSSSFEHYNDTNADIKTLEGIMHANFGDFIIRGVNGEVYPCKPDIFEKTYEEVKDGGIMFKFHIKGFAACNDPYYYDSNYPVDIKVNAETRTEAVEKAEKVLEYTIHRSTMRITIEEGGVEE